MNTINKRFDNDAEISDTSEVRGKTHSAIFLFNLETDPQNCLKDNNVDKLNTLSIEATNKLIKKFEADIKMYDIKLTVQALSSSKKQFPIEYNVTLEHNHFPIKTASDINFSEVEWSYLYTIDKYTEALTKHNEKLDTVLKNDAELSYFISMLDKYIESGAKICDISPELKGVTISVPFLSDNQTKIHAEGESWNETFSKIKKELLRYDSLFE